MSSFGAFLLGKFDFNKWGKDVEEVGAKEMSFFRVSWWAERTVSSDFGKSEMIFEATSFHQEGIVDTRTVRKVA